MFLLMISDQIVMIINFYVAFCFTVKKTNFDYCWILTQLKILYMRLKLFNPMIIVTNMKKTLIFDIETIFSEINHVFCLWHINNNVLANCKKSFDTKKNWDFFFTVWKTMIYFFSEKEFWENWNQFFQNYHSSHDDCVEYLLFIYIINYR